MRIEWFTDRKITGLKVTTSSQSPYGLRIEPGEVMFANGIRITLQEAVEVELTPPGSRTLTNQRYTLHGEARTVPGGWNGEGIRGAEGSRTSG
ncbi:hypothetical protein N6H14_00190 [Paenibacillus sp. CC-CFT747]|nr:hypothetical protein N6H14_00190 [Paenibacillus sp. CC-CFT747]